MCPVEYLACGTMQARLLSTGVIPKCLSGRHIRLFS